MIDFSHVISEFSASELIPWAKLLPEQIKDGLCQKRFGDLKRWLAAMDAMPEIQSIQADFRSQVCIGNANEISTEEQKQLYQCLHDLRPWRKGPFNIFGINLDTEWRSDLKWDRLLPHISPLENRTILDVGCGNGYHCWRMLGENARRIIGIDPSPRFIVQFYMLKKLLDASDHTRGKTPVDILPVGIQDVPDNLCAFDTTFSMGVLYHRRSPMDHIKQLQGTLTPGGELVLETLIIDGKKGECLVPEGRYAKMNNVWFIPSADTLVSWLIKCGFENARCVDVSITTLEEQRITPWVNTQSLNDFLDPNDKTQTVEGHPSPRRGIFIANKKSQAVY